MKNNISAYRLRTKPRFSKKSGIGNFSGARMSDFSVVGLFCEVVLLLFFFLPKSCTYRLRCSSQLPQCLSPTGSCYCKSTTSLLSGRHGSPWHGLHSWERRLHFSSHAPIKLSGTLFQEHFSSNAPPRQPEWITKPSSPAMTGCLFCFLFIFQIKNKTLETEKGLCNKKLGRKKDSNWFLLSACTKWDIN